MMTLENLVTLILIIGVIGIADSFKFSLTTDYGCLSNRLEMKQFDGKPVLANERFIILYSKVIFSEEDGEIVGLQRCVMPDWKCEGVGNTTATNVHVMLAISLGKTTAEDLDVNYRYNDKVFKMSKLERPPSEGLQNIYDSSWSSRTYIFPNKVEVDGDVVEAAKCSKPLAQIAGHGYFVTKFEKGSDTLQWYNMYYEPMRIGEYLITKDNM